MVPEPDGKTMTVTKDAEVKEEDRATWFELFSDLAFVAAIFHVTHIVAPSFAWDSFWRFLGALLVVWMAWVGFTFLNFRMGGWYPAKVSSLKFVAFIVSGIVGAWLPPMSVLRLVVGVMVVGIIAGQRARPKETP